MAGKRTGEVDIYVAKRLRAARMEAGLSQEASAGKIGVTFQQLQKYETGRNRVSAGRLAALANIYGKSPGWFFVGSPAAMAPLNGRAADVGSDFLSLPYAADLARDYIAIEGNAKRHVVATVANALRSGEPTS